MSKHYENRCQKCGSPGAKKLRLYGRVLGNACGRCLTDDLFKVFVERRGPMTVGDIREGLKRCLPGRYIEGRDFQADVEEAFPDMARFGPKSRQLIHELAWEAGHAAGYCEVLNHYFDFIRLARMVAEESR